MHAASGRKRASNGATRLRLHSVGATNSLLGVRGRWLQREQHRHCEGRGPFVAVHDGRSICSLMTLHSMSLKIKLFGCMSLHKHSAMPTPLPDTTRVR